MRATKIVLALFGVLVLLISAVLVAAGAALAWAYGTQRDANGFFTSPEVQIQTVTYAITSERLDLGTRPAEASWRPGISEVTVRVRASSLDAKDVFIGIAPAADVDRYLAGVPHDEIVEVGDRANAIAYRRLPGDRDPVPPVEETFWTTTAVGSGPQSVEWDLREGAWKLVIMNADASPGVAANVGVGARAGVILPVAIGLLAGGVVGLAAGLFLLIAAIRYRPSAPAGQVGQPPPGGPIRGNPPRPEGSATISSSTPQPTPTATTAPRPGGDDRREPGTT